MESLLEYLKGNIQFINQFLNEYMPDVQMVQPEGTYLAWLDFKNLGLEDEKLEEIITTESNVGLDKGPIFGTGGEGFMRMNFACPRSTIEKGLQNIYQALKSATTNTTL